MLVNANGVKIYLEIHGGSENNPANVVIFLHGMTLNGREWEPVVQTLSEQWTPITVDLVGHGHSEAPQSPDPYQIDKVVKQLKAVMGELGYDQANWVGYSMGGRILLQFAVRHPEYVQSMVLESTTPGIESEEKRKKRRLKDKKLAKFLDREGLENFVDRWMQAPIFDSQQSVCVQKRQGARQLRLRNDPEGIKNSLNKLGRGQVAHVWNRLEELMMPINLITGELDEKHVGIHSRMQDQLSNSRNIIVDDVGHNVHFEDPNRFIRECVIFFNEI